MICLHYFPLFLPFFQISGFIVVLSLTIYSIYILRSYFWHRHTTNLSIGELWSGPKKKKFLFYQFVICYIYVHVMGSQNINNHVIFITLLPRTSIRTRKHLKTTNGYLFIILIHSLSHYSAGHLQILLHWKESVVYYP